MKKILIIEDDFLITKVYSTRLKADGFEVLSASDGKSGLDLAKKAKPNLIVLDIMMPKMSGLDVLKELKRDPGTSRIRVIVYSNLAREDEITEAKKLGAVEFIAKASLTPHQVVAKIESYLK